MNAPLWRRISLHTLVAIGVLLAASPARAQGKPSAAPAPSAAAPPTRVASTPVSPEVALVPPALPVLTPQYEVTVADASTVKSLLSENSWSKEFTASNLYRGAMSRLGPIVFTVGNEKRDSWKGRLLDFLVDRLMAGRPVTVGYFDVSGLVSPFGITLSGLSAQDVRLAHLILETHRSGADVLTPVFLRNGESVAVAVIPLTMKSQRFAAVEFAGGLTISRDPRLAATLARRSLALAASAAPSPRPAGTIDIDTHRFFSAWSGLLDKYFGVAPGLRLTFDFDEKKARFTPARAELALNEGHRLGTGPVSKTLLAAIPADTLMFATAFLPDLGPLSGDALEAYLALSRPETGSRFVPVTLLFLGMHAKSRDQVEPLSVLLVPRPASDRRTEKEIESLFSGTQVHVTKACAGFVALSPSAEALARMGAVCGGRQPSFAQMPQPLVQRITRGSISAAAFLNAGGFLKSALLHGWRLEGFSSPGRPAERPPEIAQALELLDRLPAYAFAGRENGHAVVMIGAEP